MILRKKFDSSGSIDASGRLISSKAAASKEEPQASVPQPAQGVGNQDNSSLHTGDRVAPEIQSDTRIGLYVAKVENETLTVGVNGVDDGSGSAPVETSINPPDQNVRAPEITSPATQLIRSLWRSPDLVYQTGKLDRITKRFKNTPVKDANEAAHFATRVSASGDDCYFACSAYKTADSRTVDNVVGAFAFWMDLDVGVDKNKDGRGYESVDDAKSALRTFRGQTGLPKPTHVVNSGAGLHIYWVLDSFIDRDTWQAYAGKLKAVTKKMGFLADPTRTADAASVLRIPGTLNYKYDLPRPVTLAYASQQYICQATMLQAIAAAFAKISEAKVEAIASSVEQVPATVTVEPSKEGLPNLIMLASALKQLTPDCDDYTWKFHRLAPLARIAREHPALAQEAYALAKSWSSGELGDKPSTAWVTPGTTNGLTGAVEFEAQWKRFLQPNASAKQTSVGTIYHHAKEVGWSYETTRSAENVQTAKTAQVIKLDGNQAPLAAMQEQFGMINMGGKLCVFDRISLTTVTNKGAAQRLMLSSLADGALLIRRALAADFSLIDPKPILGAFWDSPQTVCYAGVDFNPDGTSASYLNLWVGPTIIPRAGKWTLIKVFLLEVICSGVDGHYQYLLGFIAHALQYPGVKPGVMIALLGGQGIGKGTFARILQKIWSATFLQVHNVDAVTGAFNAALERAFMVFLDEALFHGNRSASDALKSLVTEPVLQINEKHQPSRQIQSFHRFIVATNASHLKHTDRDDRRDLALRVSEVHKNDHQYWQALYQEIDNGGVEALVSDLLAMNLSGFNVRVKPETAELLEQKLQSLEPIQRWWHECLVMGTLNEEDGWPDFIATVDALYAVCEMNGGKMFRKPSALDVVHALKKLCPSATAGQKKDGLSRRRGLELPPLEQARAEFDQYIGGKVQW
jgi:hypothetical protein